MADLTRMSCTIRGAMLAVCADAQRYPSREGVGCIEAAKALLTRARIEGDPVDLERVVAKSTVT